MQIWILILHCSDITFEWLDNLEDDLEGRLEVSIYFREGEGRYPVEKEGSIPFHKQDIHVTI